MPDVERYRLFVALAVPDDVKAKLEAAQADLRRVLPDRNVLMRDAAQIIAVGRVAEAHRLRGLYP